MPLTAKLLIQRIAKQAPVLQYAYSQLACTWARARRAKRNWYGATEILCQAHHRIEHHAAARPLLLGMKNILQETCYVDGVLATHCQNRLLRDASWLAKASRIRRNFMAEPLADRLRLRLHRDDGDLGRQGNLIILKTPRSETGERGCMLLKYSHTFEQLPALFTLPQLTHEYRIVLEPSWFRNSEASLFLYAGSDADVVMQSSETDDREFLRKLGANLVPIPIGAADWIDPECFAPSPESERRFDVVMVASWSRIKRHKTLLRDCSIETTHFDLGAHRLSGGSHHRRDPISSRALRLAGSVRTL